MEDKRLLVICLYILRFAVKIVCNINKIKWQIAIVTPPQSHPLGTLRGVFTLKLD